MTTINLNSAEEKQGAIVILENVIARSSVAWYKMDETETSITLTNVPDAIITLAQNHPDWTYAKPIGVWQHMGEVIKNLEQEFDSAENKTAIVNTAIINIVTDLLKVVDTTTLKGIIDSI